MPEKTWTIREVLSWTTNKFKNCDIETPLLDAQLLLSKVLNTEKINLYLDMEKPLSAEERSKLRELVKRRLTGEPVAYILNEKYWYNLKLYVDENVLIPRPETECLADFVVEALKTYEKTPQVIFDFCTGSGCLALSMAKTYPQAKVVGIDISQKALDVAQKNAQLNKVTNVEWLNLDLTLEESYLTLKNKYQQAHVILSNPPYVSEEEFKTINNTVKNFEPKLALVASEDGLFIGKQILKYVEQFSLLNSEYFIFGMEMGVNHPELLMSHPIKNYKYNSNIAEKKDWFSLCDMESKNRFLCGVKTS